MQRTSKKNRKIGQEKSIATTLGSITLKRNVDYCEQCKKTYPQGEQELNCNETFRATEDFIEKVTYIAQMVPSFGNTKDLLAKVCGLDISISQVQKITEYSGRKVHEKQMEAAENAYARPDVATPFVSEKDRKDTTLYIMADGCAVNTRVQDEDGSTWREMKLGMVFSDEDIRKQNKHIYIEQKEYVAYLGSVNEFKKLIFEAAARAGYGKIKQVVVIGDGAKWIWNMCEELFPDAVCILDLFHMKENIYDYAKALFPNEDKKYTKWAEMVSYYIETDQLEKALKKIKSNPLPEIAAKNTVNLEGYIKNNRSRINYLQYRNQSFYVGSGMIESGNKVVVQKRLKQAGMRWSKEGAQEMVALRAKYESGRWEEVQNLIASKEKAA